MLNNELQSRALIFDDVLVCAVDKARKGELLWVMEGRNVGLVMSLLQWSASGSFGIACERRTELMIK